jgi:branched-chain amino acid transport system permease protein
MDPFGFYFAQLLTGLANASSLFLIACGLSIIFGVTRIVNFAHGSLYMLGAYIAYSTAGDLAGWRHSGLLVRHGAGGRQPWA